MKFTHVAVIGVLAIAAWQGYGCEQRKHGVLDAKIKVAEARADSLAQEYAALSTAKARVRVRVDSFLATDTVFRDTTVRRLIADERQVCDELASVCAQEKANLTELLRLERKKRPSRFGCAAPLVATTKGVALGVACGIRFP
jgi:hypothetical protein